MACVRRPAASETTSNEHGLTKPDANSSEWPAFLRLTESPDACSLLNLGLIWGRFIVASKLYCAGSEQWQYRAVEP
jgi:hypothetical protein